MFYWIFMMYAMFMFPAEESRFAEDSFAAEAVIVQPISSGLYTPACCGPNDPPPACAPNCD